MWRYVNLRGLGGGCPEGGAGGWKYGMFLQSWWTDSGSSSSSTMTSSTDFYSQLMEEDEVRRTSNVDKSSSGVLTFTSGGGWNLKGRRPGVYPLATICLGALCVILLLSLITVAAQKRDRPEGGAEVGLERQRQEANVSVLMDTIKALQQEKQQLQRDKEQLLIKLNTKTPTRAPEITTAHPVVCPTDWHLFNRSCYLIPSQSKSWSRAQTFCQDQGGHLAIIHTAEEQTFLWNLLPRGHWNAYWFGITDGETEDVWKWVDGTSVVGGFWEEGEPNNHINEDCGYIVKTQVLTRVPVRSWYDAPCSMQLPFICEKGPSTSTSTGGQGSL